MKDSKHTNRKDSQNALSGDIGIISKPQLAVFYENAHKEIYGCKIFVRKNLYPTFETMSDDLRNLGIDDRKYAYTVTKLMSGWLREKHLSHIPISTFCGNWCFEKFLTIHKSETVEITSKKQDREQELLHSELIVARYYISKNLEQSVFRFMNAVGDIRKLLSDEWFEMYISKTIPNSIRSKAVDILSDEFGVGLSLDYNDIIRKLRCKQ